MDRSANRSEPDPTLPWDYSEWRHLHTAVVRLEAPADATPCVLVVDDDPATRLLYALNLELEGLRVIEASDGKTGLARARGEHPDLILTDVMMPGFDGFELAKQLRSDESTSRIPLIFVSGEMMEGRETRAHEYGALAFLAKPVDVRALAALVAGVFAAARTSVQASTSGDGALSMGDAAA